MKHKCRVCSNTYNNKNYQVKEMMFGLREPFNYFQCSKCYCLQISDFPENMEMYYPDNYYSFRKDKNLNFLKKALIHQRNKYAVFGDGILGKFIYNYFPYEKLKCLAEIKDLSIYQYILDVGCGSGYILKDLKKLGFKNLLGIDPYLSKNAALEKIVKLEKKSIFEVSGNWNLIMFHHVFEHLENPLETLLQVNKLLAANGNCIIRLPTVSSFAWDFYRENWVQLDAPRHFFLHSVESISFLAEKANLKVKKIIYDSNELQFWGSEQYLKDIPLISENSFQISKKNSIFSKKEIIDFRKKAENLNKKNKGDAFAIYLTKNNI